MRIVRRPSGVERMKLVAYLRVSTDKQVERGMGLTVQEQAVKQWAKANGHRLTAIFRDEGISGSNGVDTRIGLHEALQAIQNGAAEGVVVYKLDRLARQLTVQEATLAQVWKHNGHVFACDLGEVRSDDPDDPMRTAMRQMVGVFAQLERGMIAARMRAGRSAKAAAGGYAYGSPAFGFRSVDGELIADEDETSTANFIMELHEQGRSLRQIVNALHAEHHRPKRGTVWYPKTIATIIRRQTHA